MSHPIIADGIIRSRNPCFGQYQAGRLSSPEMFDNLDRIVRMKNRFASNGSIACWAS